MCPSPAVRLWENRFLAHLASAAEVRSPFLPETCRGKQLSHLAGGRARSQTPSPIFQFTSCRPRVLFPINVSKLDLTNNMDLDEFLPPLVGSDFEIIETFTWTVLP